ncbi:MAG TPA: GAF domain-containing SpoIIE family protein phosphatase [Actinomycetota bacterium]|nr:GAF domain-containing SpoIIE family protein phosphatase [Actinomycetota bacterium]
MSTEFADAPTDPALQIADAAISQPDAGTEGPVNEDAIWRLAIALTAAVTPYDVGVAVAKHGEAAAGASYCNLALLDPVTEKVRVIHGSQIDPAIAARWAEFQLDEQTPLCDAMRTGRPVLVPTEADVAREYPHLLADTLATSLTSTASLPLRAANGSVIGAIGLGWRALQRFGTKQTLRLERISQLASQSLERALEEGERSRRTAQEAADAHVLQAAFLPATLPQTARLETAAAYLPASDAPMGGDWYDAFPVDGGMCLVIGDVGGHGLQAAAVMVQLRNAVRAYADEDPTPHRVMARLNRMLCRLEPEETATGIIALWNESTGIITRSNAGHPTVLRCRTGETDYLFPPARHAMLGVDPTWVYGQEDKVLRSGTTLLFYTDGLVEIRGRTIDDGMEELRDFVAELEDLSPQAVCDEVLGWRLSTAAREDDICVLAVRIR